jgi:uncharacterized protein (DUF2062 family)
MFGRRRPLPLVERTARWVWPRGGWTRQGIYVAHRIKRLPGTPNSIAAGFACGVAVSFTPFIGFHFVLAALLALLMRGNIIASAIGTVAGNPWTFPVIWIWTYNIGLWVLGQEQGGTLPEDFSIQYIFDNPLKVLWPMAVGSLPTGLSAWLIAFFSMRVVVKRYRLRRRSRLRAKLRRKRFRERLRREKSGQAAASRPEGEEASYLSRGEEAPATPTASAPTAPEGSTVSKGIKR